MGNIVKYNCQVCGKQNIFMGERPMQCHSCGKIVCLSCSPISICPTDILYVTKEEQEQYKSIKMEGDNCTHSFFVAPGWCCGIVFFFLSISLLMTPNAVGGVSSPMIIIGAILSIIFIPLKIRQAIYQNKYFKAKEDFMNQIVKNITQRKMQT